MELSTKERGNLTELQCLTEFYSHGYKVSIPYGENCRYDFILDTGKQLLKIQVKTSHPLKNNKDGFIFATCSTRVNSKGSIRYEYNENEIDFFATYYQGKCYLIHVSEVGKREKVLRFSYPTNGQKEHIFLAKDYEFEQVIKAL